MRYPLNQPVRISTTVKDVTGALINATTLTLLVKLAQADGTWLTTGTYASPVNDSTGTYHQDIPATDLTVAGHYQYTWTATGTGAGVSLGDFDVFDPFETAVQSTALGQLYCSVEEVKSRLGISDAADNFELALAVDAASRSIDEVTGRYFWRGTDTRTYVPQSIYRQDIDDLAVSTGLQVKVDRDGDGTYEESWTLGADYQLEVAPGRYNTAAKGEPWPYTGFSIIGPKFIPIVWPWSHQDRIQVTGTFGWPSVPAAVKQATLIAATDLFRLKDAPFGIAGFGEFAVRIQQNPRVMQLLKRYISGSRVGV